MRLQELTWTAALALCMGSCWAQDSGPTDAQIAAIVVTANQVDIDAGKLAQTRSQSKEGSCSMNASDACVVLRAART